MELIIIMAVMLGFMWLMTRGARKAQKAQLEQREAAVVIGNNVVTNAGFFGRIVDIDGDAVTLESPSGDESVWLKTAIMAQMDIPLAMDDNIDEPYLDGTGSADPSASVETDNRGAGTQSTDGLSNSNPFDDDEEQRGNAWK